MTLYASQSKQRMNVQTVPHMGLREAGQAGRRDQRLRFYSDSKSVSTRSTRTGASLIAVEALRLAANSQNHVREALAGAAHLAEPVDELVASQIRAPPRSSGCGGQRVSAIWQ